MWEQRKSPVRGLWLLAECVFSPVRWVVIVVWCVLKRNTVCEREEVVACLIPFVVFEFTTIEGILDTCELVADAKKLLYVLHSHDGTPE